MGSSLPKKLKKKYLHPEGASRGKAQFTVRETMREINQIKTKGGGNGKTPAGAQK